MFTSFKSFGTIRFDAFTGGWNHIAAVGTTSYAAPLGAPTMLAVDTVRAIPHGIVTEGVDSGGRKWSGIASMGTHIYAPLPSYMPPSYMPPS